MRGGVFFVGKIEKICSNEGKILLINGAAVGPEGLFRELKGHAVRD